MNIWNKFRGLALSEQIVFVGSFLAILGAFLPWYSDTDQFKTGTTFLGITGPLYLAGLLVLISSAMCLTAVIMKMRESSALPVKENHLFIGASVMSLLMVVMAMSVYFHPKFGINLADKQSGIGMILAAIGGLAVLGGGILGARKKASVRSVLELHSEHLAEIETMPRETSGLNPTMTIEEAEKMANQHDVNYR